MPINVLDKAQGISGGFTPIMDSFTASFDGSIGSVIDINGAIQRALNPVVANFFGTTSTRTLHHESDFETGFLQDLGVSNQGNDNCKIFFAMEKTVTDGDTLTVTGITNANPGRITCSTTISDKSLNNQAWQLIGVLGMTEVNTHLVRFKNISGNSADLYLDHTIGGNEGAAPTTYGTKQFDTTGFGTYSSGGIASSYGGVDQVSPTRDYGPAFNCETIVVPSELVPPELTELVTPQLPDANFFFRSLISFNKDYGSGVHKNGPLFGPEPRNKPRMSLDLPHTQGLNGQVAYDREAFCAMALYVPANFVEDVAEPGQEGEIQFWDIKEDAGDSGGGFCDVTISVPGTPSEYAGVADSNVAHWLMKVESSTTSTTTPTRTFVDFGPVSPDYGKWTTFIARIRANPTVGPVPVNYFDEGVSGAMDQFFDPNVGIFQMWKDTGEPDGQGKRTLVLTDQNEVNTGVGAVPRAGFNIEVGVRLYKHSWHRRPRTHTGTYWFGWDNIRWGYADEGTTFSDVDPFRRQMP